MKFQAFEKDNGKTKVYAFEVTREEIEKLTWSKRDQEFFESCSKGSLSRQVLGIAVLARRLEETKDVKPRWKPIVSSDPDESGRS